MASTREINRRIKSVANTRQITKAMEMVSAAKMRRAQQAALRTREYASKALELLTKVSAQADPKMSPLLAKRDGDRLAIVLVAPDKGLCGGLISNILKKTVKFLESNSVKNKNIEFVVCGKKARDFVAKTNFSIAGEFINLGDHLTSLDGSAIAEIPLSGFIAHKYDQVILVYTDFVSTLTQNPVVKQILPFDRAKMIPLEEIGPNQTPADQPEPEAEVSDFEYIFEPSPEIVLKTLVPRLVEMQIFQALLESKASEHSARMIAMKNASENAEEMIDDLQFTFNQARQAGITAEIAEISAGAAALAA